MPRKKKQPSECCAAFSELVQDFQVLVGNHKDTMNPQQFAYNVIYLLSAMLFALKDSTLPKHLLELYENAVRDCFDRVKFEREILNAERADNKQPQG